MCDIPNPIICPGWLVICRHFRLVKWKLHNHIMVFSPWHIAIYWVIGLASGKIVPLGTMPPLFWETVVPAEFFFPTTNWLVKSSVAGRGQVVEKFHLPSAGGHRGHCSTGNAAELGVVTVGNLVSPGKIWEGFIKQNAPEHHGHMFVNDILSTHCQGNGWFIGSVVFKHIVSITVHFHPCAAGRRGVRRFQGFTIVFLYQEVPNP